jgi:hypothetical protein
VLKRSQRNPRILDLIIQDHALYQNTKHPALTWTMPCAQHKTQNLDICTAQKHKTMTCAQHKTQYHDMYRALVDGRRHKSFFRSQHTEPKTIDTTTDVMSASSNGASGFICTRVTYSSTGWSTTPVSRSFSKCVFLTFFCHRVCQVVRRSHKP